ncbi:MULTISPECIES: hypothetical protein [Streptomyces]|uniref:Bacterial CdiA-CT RNAse A domain-containing protein n=1 Tax=Streptomyces fradiae ATCC 10745 = DSM 40063 TaxID=1319510 RepID=A0A1Y2P0Q5_STRFR|nr:MULTISPECIES: hypothetical protein [Streptomyces]KAF0651070.1 hypothetical protein K701_04665 [Streptomyces fradiae ATCC 10745 = DSM 40063]OSY53041.1 hypothetical protein BG846_01307 [Streptomyces fradiae ATCC 10745 = DSM 40063]QEV12821.1 hypothetical protein CP974_13310 [Streptomyces fradiae ATCC 10745 = DSM 40063]
MLVAAKEIAEDMARSTSPKSLVTGVTSVVGKGAGLVLSFDVKAILDINTAKLNRIVDTYTGILDGLTARMEALKGPLEEAYLSAPKFEAGVARAQGFGVRALEEFKESQVWLKVDSTGKYDLNLTANEYFEHGHTLDKHVGKTHAERRDQWRKRAQAAGRPDDPKSGYKGGGMDAKAYDVTGIDTRIRYDSSRNPPFTVMTSMPSKP